MQRLFSTFPDHWPGAGLALLRCAAAIPMMDGIAGLAANGPGWIAVQLILTVSSALLLAGCWTPVAGALMAVLQVSLLLLHSGNPPMHIVLGILGAALAMTGPGAWSVDARRFGRTRLRIPER